MKVPVVMIVLPFVYFGEEQAIFYPGGKKDQSGSGIRDRGQSSVSNTQIITGYVNAGSQ